MRKIDRTGEVVKMNNGMKCEIIRYGTKRDIDVRFEDGYVSYNKDYGNFKKGIIKNPYVTKVCGIGVYDKENAEKEIYKRWIGMLKRCYSEKELYRCPTYTDCSVCEEWHLYSSFEKWYKDNYYEIEGEIMELDKDILLKGNKVYSPNMCVFIPHRINSLFTKSKKSRGNYPIGVNFHKKVNKYNSKLNILGSRIHLGYFDTPEEAFNAYKKAKEQYIKQVADEYKDKIPKKLYDAMYRYEVEITD